MAHGKTLEMIAFSRAARYRNVESSTEKPARDRSLAGKARIRARRAK